MSERAASAYNAADTHVVEGFSPMSTPYQRVIGLVVDGQTLWDGRADTAYYPPDIRLPEVSKQPALPPQAGEVMRVRTSALTFETINEEDKKLADQACTDILGLIPEAVPFTKLTDCLKQGNASALRPATYGEALYALELARLVTTGLFQHRIACYEVSLTAARYCHMNNLAVDWCLGVSLCHEAIPHAWLEAGGEPVRGESDEVIKGAYRKLLQV